MNYIFNGIFVKDIVMRIIRFFFIMILIGGIIFVLMILYFFSYCVIKNRKKNTKI